MLTDELHCTSAHECFVNIIVFLVTIDYVGYVSTRAVLATVPLSPV